MGGWLDSLGDGWMNGWLDYLRLKPAQPPIWVEAWAELGKNSAIDWGEERGG